MAPKKEAPKNAFFYFMLDFKKTNGRKFNNMKDVADAAGPHWARMSREERQPFEDLAKKEKSGNKYTSTGENIDDVDRREREEQLRIQKMQEKINCDLKAANDSCQLQDKLFFIIHVNIFCKAQGRYYPAEIAIACFSLEDGVHPQNVFHHIIKPGPLPLGYAGEAKLISDQTHKLGLPLVGDCEDNVAEVYHDMKQFLFSKLPGPKRIPDLYADEKLAKMVQSILDTWCEDFEDDCRFNVYNLQYLFMELKNFAANDTVWPNLTMSTRELEKDPYVYARGIVCEYHDSNNIYTFCSRSIVIRSAYVICNNCCKHLNIVLNQGTHVPDGAMTPASSRASSRASTISTRSSKFQPSIRDDDSETLVSFSSKSEWDSRSEISGSSEFSLNNDNFPGLKFNPKSASTNSQPFYSISQDSNMSQSSSRSYAGATGLSRWGKESERSHSSVLNNNLNIYQSSGNFDESDNRVGALNDPRRYPALGRGRRT